MDDVRASFAYWEAIGTPATIGDLNNKFEMFTFCFLQRLFSILLLRTKSN